MNPKVIHNMERKKILEEHFDLADMTADEIAYRNLPKETADKAIRYIRESSRLLEMLDLIISEAIDAVT